MPTGKPDLTVRNGKWIDDTTAIVELSNVNPFVAASGSVVRFESYKCSGHTPTVQATKDTQPLALGKGEKKLVKVNLPKGVILTVTADVGKVVTENDENNNQFSLGNASACIG